MDKKNLRNNQNGSTSKGVVPSDCRKSLETVNKGSRNSRRREPPNNNYATSKFDPPAGRTNKNLHYSKTAYNNCFKFDKRDGPRGDGGYQRNFNNRPLAAYGTGLDNLDEYDTGLELNSVLLSRSKKQNLNHLLNFNYAPRERNDPMTFVRSGNHHTTYTKRIKYNKEQFLQANCQFIVKANHDYRPFILSPDTLVDWHLIEQIHVFSADEPQCPICLYHPVAGKMTKCGHLYCWPCILHYLALSDKTWRKCPICYDAVHIGDLKSAISMPQSSYNVGDYITLQLMCRKKGTFNVMKASGKIVELDDDKIPHLLDDDNDVKMHAKLLLADENEVLTIIDRERNELKCQLTSDSDNCPESIFVQNALELLGQREKLIFESIKINGKKFKQPPIIQEICTMGEVTGDDTSEEACGGSNDINVSIEVDHDNLIMDELIDNLSSFVLDDETNLTAEDINIVPVTTDSNYFYFYQAINGQHLYLHSINVQMLQAAYKNLERAPAKIFARILQRDTCSMSEALRKRLKYLQHLPVTTQFEVVELKLGPAIIPPEILANFKEKLNERRMMREQRDREEKKRERKINEVNDRQIGKIISETSNIDVSSEQEFPKSWEYDLSGSTSLVRDETQPVTIGIESTGNSFANILINSPSQPTVIWPALSPNQSRFPTKNSFEKLSSPKMVTGTVPKIRNDSNASEEDLYLRPVPEFRTSFGSAISEALEKQAEIRLGSNKNSGKLKKKGKKMILFSTGGGGRMFMDN